MASKIVLSSGNVFWFVEKPNFHPYAFVVNAKNEFKGGFLGPEAIRKFKNFRKFGEVTSGTEPDFKSLDYMEYMQILDSVSFHFEKAVRNNIIISDTEDCDGTGSHAGSCSERQKYYIAANLANVYGSNLKFHLAIFIANHISVFGVGKFRETFFGEIFSNVYAETKPERTVRHLHRAGIGYAKPPASYVRGVVNYYTS